MLSRVLGIVGLMCCLTGRVTAQPAPELIVDVDVNDDVWLRDHAMTEHDVNALHDSLSLVC